MILNLLFVLLGAVLALFIAETLLLIGLYRHLRQNDINMFSDSWYAVRVKKFPFTVE